MYLIFNKNKIIHALSSNHIEWFILMLIIFISIRGKINKKKIYEIIKIILYLKI